MTRYTILALICLLSAQAIAQGILADSVRLASATSKISKVVARQHDPYLAVAWQTDYTDSLNVQVFASNGNPISQQARVFRQVEQTQDFDMAMDTHGNTVLAWSRKESQPYLYSYWFATFDVHGNALTPADSLGKGNSPFMNASTDPSGEFLIAWNDQYNTGLNVRLFKPDRSPDGGFQYAFLSPLMETVAFNDHGEIALGWILNQEATPSAKVTLFDKQGTALNDAGAWDYSSRCCMSAIDFDYEDAKTVFSLTLTEDLQYGTKKGTYFSMISWYNGNQSRNFITLDAAPSVLTQVAQNHGGYSWVGWKGVAATADLKAQWVEPGGQTLDQPIIVWPGLRSFKVTAVDFLLPDDNQATAVLAVGGLGQNVIVLEKFRITAPKETPEIKVSNISIPVGVDQSKPLSSSVNHAVVWQDKVDDKNGVFLQLFDTTFAKSGSIINVTGLMTAEVVYDAAIDSLGNVTVVWKTSASNDINAAKYDAEGTLITAPFKVNQVDGTENDFPRVSANAKGDFIIVWRAYHGAVLEGRLFRTGFDSGEVTLKECCMGQVDYTYIADQELTMNNSGKIVFAYRDNYYNIGLLIFDEDLQLIIARTIANVISTEVGFDMAFSNQDQIVIAFTYDTDISNKIYVQRYDGMGIKIGSPLMLHDQAETLRKPGVAFNDRGDYIVSFKQRFYSTAYFMQRFKSNGEKVGGLYRMNTFLIDFDVDIATNSRNDIFASYLTTAYQKVLGVDLVVKGFSGYPPTQPVVRYHEETIEQGDSLLFGGTYLKVAGQYSHTTVAADQTVTIDILTLTVNPHFALATPVWVSAVGGDKFIDLSWVANSEPDLKQYRIYIGIDDNFYYAYQTAAVSSTSYHDTNVNYGPGYYYWLRAENNAGQLSAVSAPIIGSAVDIPPAPPQNFHVVASDGGVNLFWNANTEPDLNSYRLYRSFATDTTQAGEFWEGHETSFSYADEGSTLYYYWIKAVDTWGLESYFSARGSAIVTEVANVNPVSIYPNPTTGKIFITVPEKQTVVGVEIVNTVGVNTALDYRRDDSSVTVGHLAAGFYFVTVNTNQGAARFKVIKQD